MTLHPASRATRAGALLAATALVAAACTTDDPPAEDGSTSQAAERGLSFDGPDADALINAAQLQDLAFAVTATADGDAVGDLRLLLDGDDVTDDADVDGTTLRYAPGELPDGDRALVVAAADDVDGTGDTGDGDGDTGDGDGDTGDGDGDTGDGDGDADGPDPLHTWRFEIDAQPPEVELTAPDGAVIRGEPVTVAGSTDPGATIDAGDEQTTAGDDGAFEMELASVDDELTLQVTDRAGNVTDVAEGLGVVASRVEVDEVRTVHATFWAWATDSLRDPIEAMISDGQINSLQLDLKDEGGQIGYPSQVELANDIGADIGPLDLEETVADLHDRDIAVIGRIVAFADPALASWAWDNDQRDLVIQENDGEDYYRGSYAGFSNYAHQDVIDYNIDLAVEAAEAGVDHILWDYIRRPEGLDNYTVPGLETSPEEAVVEFARQADERLAPYGVTHGASVYGIAADRPEQIGQDIPALAEHLDYVAPMIYPSHWGPGEYDVADPNRQPYDIIMAIMEVFDDTVEDHRARVVPWLEDTPYRAWDRPEQVREQLRAAQDHGGDEWLMWNPGSNYTPESYPARD